MNGNQETSLSVVVTEARAKALKIIEANKDCVSFVRPEDVETAALFVPVVSVIKPTQDDFYDAIPGIGIMAKPPLVNLIMEKAGINILRTETSKRSEYVWVAHCFGEKRQPDGTMRPGDASYEFDASKRSELDAINQPAKYGTEIAKRKHLLETAKFGEQRAVTGAQFALIHKMAHVSRSFKTAQELMRGMMVLRIDRNVDGLLSDPKMANAAINLALGVSDKIYGPRERSVSPARPAIAQDAGLEIPAEEVQEPPPDDFQDDIPWDESPEDIARRALGNFLAIEKLHPDAKRLIQEMLDNKDATLEALTNLVERTNVWLDKARIPRPVAAGKGGAA